MKGVSSFQTGFLTHLLAHEIKTGQKLSQSWKSFCFNKTCCFFQYKYYTIRLQFFIVIAEQNNGNNQCNPSILCYLDPTGKNGDQDFVRNISQKICLFLNVIWQSIFGAKVDIIQNLFSKRSLPLWCPKGEYY